MGGRSESGSTILWGGSAIHSSRQGVTEELNFPFSQCRVCGEEGRKPWLHCTVVSVGDITVTVECGWLTSGHCFRTHFGVDVITLSWLHLKHDGLT